MNTERKVTIIEPIQQKIVAAEAAAPEKLRVAAYARVSTEQDEHQSSYGIYICKTNKIFL